jgi:hypothetical protein
MYSIDRKDQVIEREDIPVPHAGVPDPIIVAAEHRAVLAYECSVSTGGGFAIVRFNGDVYFGGPNDEALGGHPLAARGLRSYSAYEVLNSSWIRLKESRNRVHHRHDPAMFRNLRHIVITFHDSLIEFVTRDLACERWKGEANMLLEEVVKRFRQAG